MASRAAELVVGNIPDSGARLRFLSVFLGIRFFGGLFLKKGKPLFIVVVNAIGVEAAEPRFPQFVGGCLVGF